MTTAEAQAVNSFVFKTSLESTQLTGRRAANLAEFEAGLREADGSTLYHHTHRFYRVQSFLGAWNRSDFGLWVGNNLKEEAVAERMASLDTRDYPNLLELQKALLETLEPLRGDPDRWNRRVPPGLEFHFCRSVSLVLPTGYEVHNLEEFLRALSHIDLACLYYHLIEAPLHYHGDPRPFANDFSNWLADLGFTEEAQALAELNPYAGDLETLRTRVIGVFRRDRMRAALRRVVDRLGREGAGEPAALWLKRWHQESKR
ncbi:MAG TPA: DUF5752 family protein [bacterium]|nr:DUF5752 family protein [bacterium]